MGRAGLGLGQARRPKREGLDRVFKDAGFEWREPGCSMCLGTNGDRVAPGERCASTSNRNFVGRQGPGSRTHLMSPAMAAAAAVTGRLTDVRHAAGGALSMEPFKPLSTQSPLPIARPNVDTDQIFPRAICKSRARATSASYLFRDLRFDARRHREAGLRAQPAGLPDRAHRASASPTSAAAPRASTRCGRSTTTASAP